MTKRNRSTLPTVQASHTDQVIFFHGIRNEYGAFSQWYRSEFTISRSDLTAVLRQPFESLFPGEQHGPITFSTAEQFMMYSKAILFRDHQTAGEILCSDDPQMQKALGRSVAKFTEEGWDAVKFAVVELASKAKFGQQVHLKAMLLETGDRELVEAAAMDRVWGIGFREKTARVMTSRKEWGQNLLGKALMSARDQLRKEDGASG